MIHSTDQTGKIIKLEKYPQRIISLVPSITEYLSDLGLEKETVAITKFCIHPALWFLNKPRIGGTKNIKPESIQALKPDLVIAGKEENIKEQVEEVEKFCPVWTSDISNLSQACEMMLELGNITGREERAAEIINNIREKFNHIIKIPDSLNTAYLIWKDPLMAAGGDTFIHDMLYKVGLTNVFTDQSRYPATSAEELKDKQTELVLLSSEPFPFNQKHREEMQKILPGTKFLLVDGEMFSWYGSRLQFSVDYFNRLFSLLSMKSGGYRI